MRHRHIVNQEPPPCRSCPGLTYKTSTNVRGETYAESKPGLADDMFADGVRFFQYDISGSRKENVGLKDLTRQVPRTASAAGTATK